MADMAIPNPWGRPAGSSGGTEEYGPPAPIAIPNAFGRPAEPAGPPPPPAEGPPSFLKTPWKLLNPVSPGAGEAATAVQPLVKWGSDQITGEGKSEYPDVPNLLTGGFEKDFPEIYRSPGLFTPLAVGYLTGARPDQLQSIAQKVLPGSQTFADNQGNPMISFRGKNYYIAKPGLAIQDLIGFLPDAVLSGLIATGVGAVPGMAARGFLPGAMAALTHATTQGALKAGEGGAAYLAGGGSGPDPTEVIFAGLGAGLAEPAMRFGRAAVNSLWKGSGKLFSKAIDGAAPDDPLTDAMLTTTGKAILANAGGVAPGDLTVRQALDLQRILGRVTQQVRSEKGGGTARRAIQSVREGIPMSADQLTNNPALRFEMQNLRGGSGSQIIEGFDASQRQKLELAAGRRVPGNQAGVVAPDENLGEAIRDPVRAMGDRLAAREAAVWKPITDMTPTSEAVAPGGVKFGTSLNDSLKARVAELRLDNMLTVDMPGSARAAKAIRDVLEVRQPTQAGGVMQPRELNLGHVAELRRNLGAWQRQTSNPADARMLGLMRRQLDGAVDDAVTAGALSGDVGRIKQLRDAIGASRDEFEFWGPKNEAAAAFMDKLRKGDLNGTQVYNALFGAGQLNAGGPATQIIGHLRDQFGEGSQLWKDTQAAALNRVLFGSSEKAAEFTPLKLVQRIDEALDGRGSAILRDLRINPDELRELQEAARTLERSRTTNPPGTAAALRDQARRALKSIPVVNELFYGQEAKDRAAAVLTSGRLRGNMFPPGPGVPPLGIMAGGLLGQEYGAER